MKLYAHPVMIYLNNGESTKGIYIHNEDSTYRHWVTMDGRCATAVKGVANPVSYKYIDPTNPLIIEE